MIILTNTLLENSLKEAMVRIISQHTPAFSMEDRRAHSCYFLKENSESMILLSRLFQKFGRNIKAYGTTRPIFEDDIPRRYFDYVGALTNDTGDIPTGVFKIKKFVDEWNKMKNLKKKVELKL